MRACYTKNGLLSFYVTPGSRSQTSRVHENLASLDGVDYRICEDESRSRLILADGRASVSTPSVCRGWVAA